ncbi:hypothetical protein DFA_03602 [Cavenderia fasciculata]|uniref:Uncharacterized protein n=1 Tax=Cavenderia fasciculata TaxID=261658 RepID=F4PI70_CACFS|nr:uncharacterized protein DFA_03602 [Cavenderia fasciculata]EGG25353.1 hypothetical protein DFA_03602 [Cavenderia fasciculata]|eukprot:XP_004363204.1 hypothetical protein DFA_03602 [Cavenderia fasciculata]
MHSLIIIIFILSIFVSFVVSHNNNDYGVVYNTSSSSSLFSSFNHHVELQSISINDHYVYHNTSSFNHVELQPIPIISIAHKNNKSYSFIHPLSINNSSDIIVSQCQSQPLPLPLPLISNYSTTNLILLEEKEKTVQLNSSTNTISNTCLDNNPIICFPSMSSDIIIQYNDEHSFNISIINNNNIKNNNNNNNKSVSFIHSLFMYIQFNSSDVSIHFQLPPLLLNHSSPNHFLLAEEEEKKEVSFQLNNTIIFSLFNHVEHQSNTINNNNISFHQSTILYYNNNNNLSFNSSMLTPFSLNVLSQSHFQLPLNHSTTNNHIHLEEEEDYVQLNRTTNTIPCFEHQPIPIISIHSSMSPIPLNSSDVLFNINLDQEVSSSTISVSYFNQPIPNNNNNNISFFNDHQSLIPCFNSSVIFTDCQSSLPQLILNHSTTNHHILLEEEEEESVQLSCFSHDINHSSVLIDNQSNNNNNNYFSLVYSLSISPNHFNTSTSSNTSYISNTIKSTRSIASPFKSRHSNISKLKNKAVTNSFNLIQFTHSSFNSIDTFTLASNHSLNFFGSIHPTIIQQSSPINNHTILTNPSPHSPINHLINPLSTIITNQQSYNPHQSIHNPQIIIRQSSINNNYNNNNINSSIDKQPLYCSPTNNNHNNPQSLNNTNNINIKFYTLFNVQTTPIIVHQQITTLQLQQRIIIITLPITPIHNPHSFIHHQSSSQSPVPNPVIKSTSFQATITTIRRPT